MASGDQAALQADRLEQELRRQLEPGERILWSGFPPQGLVLRRQDWIAVPISLLWCVFAVFWKTAVFAGEPDIPDQFDLRGQAFALTTKPDGRGTITPDPANCVTIWARGWPGSRSNANAEFENIPRAQDVLKIFRNAQRASG